MDATKPLKLMKTDRLSNLPQPLIYIILSLMDIKSAFRTSLLSKEWKFHWTQIDSLDFEWDENLNSLINFVNGVFHHPLSLKRVRFHTKTNNQLYFYEKFLKVITSYAVSRGAEELDTNIITTLPPPSFGKQCQNQLKTLKLGPCTISSTPTPLSTSTTTTYNSWNPLVSLTTLQLYKVKFCHNLFDLKCHFDFFSSFLNLENLSLIDCFVPDYWEVFDFKIHAPRLVCLSISNFSIYELARIVISSTTLKLFNLNDNSHLPPLLKMKNCRSLEMVNIDLFPPPATLARTGTFKEGYIYHVFHVTEALRYLNPLRVSCTFPSKGKLFLNRNTQVANIKFVELKVKESEEDWLLVALFILRGLGLDQLAVKLEEMSKQMGSGDQLAPMELQLD
ncbi:hypothetical protein Ddye_013696 [Dipteronia dyeriana]|uniref:F-box domain-containing protein n=1 Tax=Dipteronia dyeriana TaxID=168575 RepID=A0AAD9X6S4_9ROSI|nr:hypothetical protein Ddye_013696 [Dipteronia dyeriana]